MTRSEADEALRTMTATELARVASMELANAAYLKGPRNRRIYQAERARRKFITVVLADRERES